MAYVVIEGPDGAGKTTLLDRLSEELSESGIDNVMVRMPGATPLGRIVRNLVKNDQEVSLDPYTEQVLMAVDQSAFVHEVLDPAMLRKKVVLSDRSNLVSGMIYARAGGMSWEQIDGFLAASQGAGCALMNLVVLHTGHDVLLQRRHHDGDVKCKIESRGEDYHCKVVKLYGLLADVTRRSVRLWRPELTRQACPTEDEKETHEIYHRVRSFVRDGPFVVDASRSADEVFRKVLKHVEEIAGPF